MMHIALVGQLNDWNYGRGIVFELLNTLTEDELDRTLPRKQLNTIRKQCEELARVQADYLKGIETKEMAFGSNGEVLTTKDLIETMTALDHRFIELLGTLKGDETVAWFGEEKNIFEHVSAMIGHEQMHIGQIIAFMYAEEIEIPLSIKNEMGLSE